MTNRLAEIKSGHLVGDDDVDWLIAEVERLKEAHANLIAEDRDEKAAGMEAAAKIPKPPYPDHEPDAGYVSGWNEGIHAFRAALRSTGDSDG